jgi:hypothetical protein
MLSGKWGAMALGAFIGVASGCADTLPDQDLRILAAVPVQKLSADILWEEYQSDADAANARYWGKAIEVTGVVTAADSDGIDAYVLFGQTEAFGVRANALDDQASELVAAAKVGERLTVKCFCAGLDGHVVLKSCVHASPLSP